MPIQRLQFKVAPSVIINIIIVKFGHLTICVFGLWIGAEISAMVLDNDDFGYKLWTPDIHFLEASAMEYIGITLRLYPNGVLMMSQHLILTVVQPLFSYKNYPSDKQTIQLRFESYAFTTPFVELRFTNEAVIFVENANGKPNFEENDVWQYVSYDAHVDTSVFSAIRAFSTATVNIDIERLSNGIILRLVAPIALIAALAGCTFWANYESRADTTITLLLSVSALYIVVFSNIPMLGYLTDMDYFTFFMFFTLGNAYFATTAATTEIVTIIITMKLPRQRRHVSVCTDNPVLCCMTV
jgi:hypothetical protein